MPTDKITPTRAAELLAGATPEEWWFNSYSTIFAGSGEDAVHVAYLPVVGGDTATRQGMVDAGLIAAAPSLAQTVVAQGAEIERLRGLLRDCLPIMREGCEDAVYGGCHVDDPRMFTPDHECSTEEERRNHEAACTAFAEAEARGEKPVFGDTHERYYDYAGKLILHIARNPYGLGTSVFRDDERIALVKRIEEATRKQKENDNG